MANGRGIQAVIQKIQSGALCRFSGTSCTHINASANEDSAQMGIFVANMGKCIDEDTSKKVFSSLTIS
jgi:hypothetical protein